MKQEEKISPNYRTNVNYRADVYQFAPHAKKLSAIIDADELQMRQNTIRSERPIAGVIVA